MRLQVWAWRCELCRHTWLAVGVDAPEQCAKCRKRNWHTKDVSVKVEAIDIAAKTIYLTNATEGNLGIPPVEIMPAEPFRKTPSQALRDIAAGKIPCKFGNPTCPCPDGDPCHHEATETTPAMEIPICGKTWWEEGEQYECLMDKGHREALAGKHGLRGMVRRLDA